MLQMFITYVEKVYIFLVPIVTTNSDGIVLIRQKRFFWIRFFYLFPRLYALFPYLLFHQLILS